MVRRALAITLVGTSLVLAACGSDDDSSESANGPTGTTGVTGTTDPTAQIPPISPIPEASDGGGSGSGGSSSRSDRSSTGDGSSEKGRSRRGNRRQQRSSGPGTSPGPASGGAPSGAGGSAPTIKSDEQAYRVAREICANVTLEGIAINLRINLTKRDDEFVARAFSRSYPHGHRDAAARGCLAGFRNPIER